jgi:CheY-like chemotaxis protein
LLESHSFVVTAESSSALSAAGFPLKTSRNLFVTAVSSGIEGLNEILKFDFDLIICDIMMPRMAGNMFYLAVAKTKPHLCDRFLFITGHSKDPKINEFLRRTGRQVLIKPVPIDKLLTTISFMLKRTGASS